MTERPYNPFRTMLCTLALLLTVAAVAAVAAPVATAQAKPPLRSSEQVELNIYDAHLSRHCGVEVVATLSGTEQRRIYRGHTPASPAHELTTFDGQIVWQARTTGKTYADRMSSVLHISYPEGIELWKPARVTVTGRHGGTFPIGGGPAGTGILRYDATVYAEDQGFPYWFTNGDPVFQHGTFAWTTRRICAQLT
jgi:Ni/Co efflux regulator RcnB